MYPVSYTHLDVYKRQIGNHEFDFDVDNMARIFKMADFPVVCANYNLDATVLKDIVKPYVVLEKDGGLVWG